MVFKPVVIQERVKALMGTVFRLKNFKNLSLEALQGDSRNLWAVEHGLQIAAEALFDIGNHILAGQFHAVPKNYEEIIRLLAQHGVMTPTLAARLKGLGGFRNVIVHDYLEVDVHIVYDRLQNGPADFEEFSRQILAWLDWNLPQK